LSRPFTPAGGSQLSGETLAIKVKLLAGLIMGVVVTAAIAYFVCGAREAVLKTRYMSEIEAPVRLSLEDIVATYDSGDTDLAEAKVRRLEQLWQQYWSTRQPIDDLHLQITDIRAEDR
jgi:hypothetical protein